MHQHQLSRVTHPGPPPSSHKQQAGNSGDLDSSASQSSLQRLSPEAAADLLRAAAPSVFQRLRSVLTAATAEWLEAFLRCDGLQCLVTALRQMTAPGQLAHLQDAVLVVNGAHCLRAVMNHQTGMHFIVHAPDDCVTDIVLSLDSHHLILKQHIWELLAAVCLYSPEGRARVVAALESYAAVKACRHRFSLLLQELMWLDAPPFYLLALVTFINALLSGEDFDARLVLRRELVALGLLEELSVLREHAADAALLHQLDMFALHHSEDWQEFLAAPVNLLDVHSLAQALWDRTCRRPCSDSLLSIMQLLLAIDGPEDTQQQVCAC